VRIETLADETVAIEVPLKPERRGGGKIRVQGLEVTIADEAIFLIEATGQQLTLDEYRDYTQRWVINATPSHRTLRDIWVTPERRRAFLDDLRRSSIHPEVLAEVLGQTEADTYDLLAHFAFGVPIHTRSERVAAFSNREQHFLQRGGDAARHVILELLEKYRVGGIDQLRPEIFRISPFREWGGAVTISRWFGGVQALGSTLTELQQRIYPETEVA
jgi:type I restriction enzyme, R subunit